MRDCPLCHSIRSLPLYAYQTTADVRQSILSCECGMIYASTFSPSYTDSIYSAPGAIGSGISGFDKRRLMGTAEIVAQFIPQGASILDIGCGQGGLLDAFRELGFENRTGLDPSQQCVDQTRMRAHLAICGTATDLTTQYQCITLSHVLEHIDDVRNFLFDIRQRLSRDGRLYIEVPDATRYGDLPLPFLDFNAEHINHFSLGTLRRLLESSGFDIIHMGERRISLTNGAPYPAIYAIAAHSMPVERVMNFIEQSKGMLGMANLRLEAALEGQRDIAIWGAGEYAAHILALPAIQSRNVVMVIDRNPLLWGREVGGCIVAPPSAILPGLPIVIAALIADESIRKSAAEMQLTNLILSLDFSL